MLKKMEDETKNDYLRAENAPENTGKIECSM